MKALFLTESELKSDSTFNTNIDGAIIKDLIFEAQEFYIIPLLGTQLYKQLISQVISGTSAITSANMTLLVDYIQPALKRYCKAEAYMNLNFKFTNKAVSTSNSEHSTAIDLSTAKELHSFQLNKAEFFGQRLREFLRTNSNSYPLYLNVQMGELKPEKTAYDCGIYLGHANFYLTHDIYCNCGCNDYAPQSYTNPLA